MDKSRKMEGDYCGQRWAMWFPWKEGVKPSDIHYWLSAICGEKAPACSTVLNWVWSWNSGKGTGQAAVMSGVTAPLKNGSMNPSRSSQGSGTTEMMPDPDSPQPVLEFHRSWVEPSDYFPTSETGINCDDLVWKLDQRDVYRLVLDTGLAPKLTTTKSVPPYITQVAWSPAGMLQYGRCLLASLTNYGCVLVHIPRSKRWLTVVDISYLWSKYCCQNWSSDENESDSIAVLQSRVEELKATAVVWSNVMSDGDTDFALLVVGLLNGGVVIWRLNSIAVRSKKYDLQPQILLHFETKMHRITTLHWSAIDQQTGWLCVGDVKGVVKMFSLLMAQDKLQCTSSTELWCYSDHIQVFKLLTLPCDITDNCPATIIAVKGSSVIAVALDKGGAVVATSHYLVGNLSITGVVVVSKQSLLVVTHSGSFNILHVVRMGMELTLKMEALNSIKVPKSAYYGITASPNKAIFCLITSFCMLFDHLIQRDPAQLTFFQLCGPIDPYNLLLTNPSQSLRGYWDCLEVIRLQGPPFRKLRDQVDMLSTYDLKVHLWLCRFAVVQGDPEEDLEKQAALKEEMELVEQLILNRHVCKRVSELMKCETLTNEDKSSLSLLLSWLQKVDAEMTGEGPTLSAVRDTVCDVRKFQHLMNSEYCSVCDQKCDRIESPTESRCPDGHSVPRCCYSFLQCSDIPFWICRVCHSIAHTSSGLVEAPVCVYCDTFLYLDDRLVPTGAEEGGEENEEAQSAGTEDGSSSVAQNGEKNVP